MADFRGFRRFAGIIGAVAIALLPLAARADIYPPQPGRQVANVVTVTSAGALPWLILDGGQSSCAVSVTGSGTGLSITAQVSPDYGYASSPTILTAPFAAGAALVANGVVSGPPGRALAFRANVGAITGGSATVVYWCNGSQSPGYLLDSSGNVEVNVLTPITKSSGYGVLPGAGTAAVIVKAAPGHLEKIVNTNVSAQTVTVTCYDNPSAASGQVLYAAVLGASQVVELDVPAVNGITCAPSAATLTGNPILVTYQ